MDIREIFSVPEYPNIKKSGFHFPELERHSQGADISGPSGSFINHAGVAAICSLLYMAETFLPTLMGNFYHIYVVLRLPFRPVPVIC